ncbi:MAG: TIGR03905 family TSCPD domain-containing protein [Clostridia bacterium]|nr:TIGR03905 family TSCPD domain-containing protein [Clostridia bacterium]
MYTYKTYGTCSRQILYDIDNGIVKSVKFIGGCSGNLQGVSKLVEGRKVEEVIGLLEGIKCRNNTSCPDQLSKALKQHIEK